MRSPTARLSALALTIIAAPAAVVAVLGYLSLRQWQTSAELLFREQARDVAVMAAQKVDMMLRHADDAFLDRLQAQLAAGAADAPALDRASGCSTKCGATSASPPRAPSTPTCCGCAARSRPIRTGRASSIPCTARATGSSSREMLSERGSS